MFPINRKQCVWITKLIRLNFYISGMWYQCPSLKALIVGTVIDKACQIYSTYLANVSLSLILTWILCVCAKSLHLCPTLSYPMDCSPPGSSVSGILQARIPEWVSMPSSRESSWPRDWTCFFYVSCIGRQVLYHYCHLGSPFILYTHMYIRLLSIYYRYIYDQITLL